MKRLFFILMVGLWGAFIASRSSRRRRSRSIWHSTADLWWPLKLAVWILFLPWMIGLLVWQADWSFAARMAVDRRARPRLVGHVVPAQVTWTAAPATSASSRSPCSP